MVFLKIQIGTRLFIMSISKLSKMCGSMVKRNIPTGWVARPYNFIEWLNIVIKLDSIIGFITSFGIYCTLRGQYLLELFFRRPLSQKAL